MSFRDGVYYVGASEQKPTENIPQGQPLIETDATNQAVNLYFFDAGSQTWIPYGGGSDVSNNEA